MPPDSPADPLIGRHFGRYQIVHRIRKGGMGVVYLAKHTLLGKPFAIKVVRAESSDDQVMIERFRREAQAVASLSHPNTVTVTDFGVTDDGLLFLVMEYLDGVTCAEVLSKTGPLPPERVVHIALQVCDSLHEAHGLKLVHRDIKPNNLLLTRVAELHDVVKVIDFGLAKQTADAEDEHGGQVTRAGLLIGTPQYMPPEQIKGQEPDHRLDIYSFGVTMFRLLTGRHPFESRDVAAMFHMHLSSPPPVPSDNLPDGAMVDLDLDDVVLRCLAKEPDDRFESTAALKDALKECASAGQWTPEQAKEGWEATRALVVGLDVEALLSKPMPPPVPAHATGPVAPIPREAVPGPPSGPHTPPGALSRSGQHPGSAVTPHSETPPPPPPPPSSSQATAPRAAMPEFPPTGETDLASGPISNPSGQTSFAHGEIVGNQATAPSATVQILSYKRMAFIAGLALVVAFLGASAALQWKGTKQATVSSKTETARAAAAPARPLPAPSAAEDPSADPAAAPAPVQGRPFGTGRDILVSVRTNPSGATVYEEGDALGETPLTISRRRAFEELTVALKLKGYRRATRTIDLTAIEGDSHELVVNLTRIPPKSKSTTKRGSTRRAKKSKGKGKSKAERAAKKDGDSKRAPWEREKDEDGGNSDGAASRFKTVD